MRRLLIVACAGMAAACGGAVPVRQPAPAPIDGPSPPNELFLDFEQTGVALGAVVSVIENVGTADIRSEVSTLAGGRVLLTGGATSGYGARLPAIQGPSTSPGAVLVLRAAGTSDPFAPGQRGFRFGADVSLDPVSSGIGAEDGDNVVQRGHFADRSQYKLQVDRGVPACRISGETGSAEAVAVGSIARGHWYRITCERGGDDLVLTVEDLEETAPVATVRVAAAFGSVNPRRGTPLTIGGKASDDGTITAARPDQLNGSIDNVFFDLVT